MLLDEAGPLLLVPLEGGIFSSESLVAGYALPCSLCHCPRPRLGGLGRLTLPRDIAVYRRGDGSDRHRETERQGGGECLGGTIGDVKGGGEELLRPAEGPGHGGEGLHPEGGGRRKGLLELLHADGDRHERLHLGLDAGVSLTLAGDRSVGSCGRRHRSHQSLQGAYHAGERLRPLSHQALLPSDRLIGVIERGELPSCLSVGLGLLLPGVDHLSHGVLDLEDLGAEGLLGLCGHPQLAL